jgi:hypothetical protein
MFTSSLLFTAFLLAGGDSFPSGPQVGDKLPDFKAHAHSGGDAGKEFKLHEKIKGGPSLIIFMHGPSEIGITRPGLQFLKPVDKYAGEQEKLASHVVWITGDKEKTEAFLKRAENALTLKSPISICLEGGKEGPSTYGLNDKVQITVLVAKDNKVVANFALTDPNAKDSTRVIAAVAKVLGKEAPKEEPKQEEKKKRPAAGGKSPELQMLMRKMINKDNDEDAVKRIAEEMKKWASNDEKKLTELREYCRMVAGLRYGTEAAQAALKKLAEK